MNVDQKLACKSYLKNKKLILIKQKEQEKAYLKDEEEVKTFDAASDTLSTSRVWALRKHAGILTGIRAKGCF